MREWLSGRASPCQGECREFESRFPLHRRNSTFLQKDRLSPVFFAYRSVSPPSRKVLRFFGSVADDLLFGIFLFYQQLLPEITLVSLLFCRTVIRFISAFARLPKSNRLKIKTRLLPRFLRAFTYNIFFMSSSRLTMPSIASCVCLRVSPYTSSCTRPTR